MPGHGNRTKPYVWPFTDGALHKRLRGHRVTVTHTTRVLLAGGGHSHIEVLRRFARSRLAGASVTLVSPGPASVYSGMLPGVVAGHYPASAARIALAPSAAGAGARWVADRVVALDLDRRVAHLAGGSELVFDLASLDVGSQPDLRVDGHEHAIGVKPIDRFLEAWEAVLVRAHAGQVPSLAMVGGGAGGVEVILAMQHRLARQQLGSAPLHLISDLDELLPSHTPAVGGYLKRLLLERGVAVHLGSAAVRVEPQAVILASGKSIASQAIFWATRARAAPWLAASGLACDSEGFVRVDPGLRSLSHPFVFASGDCATPAGPAVPKSGAQAVRQAAPLTENLRRTIASRPLVAARLPRWSLALIGTGDRSAVLSYGPLSARGAWAWRLKQAIDLRHVARYPKPQEGDGAASAALED